MVVVMIAEVVVLVVVVVAVVVQEAETAAVALSVAERVIDVLVVQLEIVILSFLYPSTCIIKGVVGKKVLDLKLIGKQWYNTISFTPLIQVFLGLPLVL